MNNKIIVIGIVFILLFTINLTLNNSHASLNAIYQVPIILVNDENVSTPNPFQQMIQLNESNYKGYMIYNGRFANFEFVYGNGTVIPAWIESNNSGKLIIWLKISSISASSSLTIYLNIFPLNDNLLNASGKNGIGEAPQLSPTYGEYDNGASVFNNYWNFAGTSTPSGINVYTSAGSVAFNNGVTIKGGTSATGGENGIATSYSFSAPIVVDYYGTQSTSPGGDSWGWNAVGFSNYLSGSDGFPSYGGTYTFIDFEGSFSTPNAYPITNQGGTITGGTLSTPSSNLFPESVWTHIYTSSVYYTYQNYVNSTGYITGASNTASLPFEIEVGNNEASYCPSGMTVYWLRTRAYPPNGVMPKVVLGSLSSIARISKSEEMNIHARIYALNLSFPQEWGIYGFFNYSIYGKNYSISISNLTSNYYLNLSINYNFSIFNNTILSYNLSLYAYKLQDYVAINHLNYKGRLNVTTTQREYNLSLNDSIIKFENVNNFYYFWNQYGYKIIGSIIIIGLFLFFISRLRRMR